MTTTMVSSMLMMHVLEHLTRLLALRGFPTQQQTSMAMVAEILMKTQMTMVMDLKTLRMIVQRLLELRRSVLKAALTPMEICGPIPPMTVQRSMVTQQKAV